MDDTDRNKNEVSADSVTEDILKDTVNDTSLHEAELCFSWAPATWFQALRFRV